MTKVKDIISVLEEWAPLDLQESYDNSGLIVGDPEQEVEKALVALDATEEVIDEAITKGCNMVITHHPIVFKGLKKLSGQSYVERVVIKAIKNDISIYAIHTNLDSLSTGVSAMICEKLGLKDLSVLQAHPSMDGCGLGMVGTLPSHMEESEFLKLVKSVMKSECVRHTDCLGNKVKMVAVCGGSGSFLSQNAIQAGADVFITGDVKYHEFFDADNQILIADIGHYESEQYTKELIQRHFKKKLPNFAVLLTEIDTNPINYLV